MKMGGSPIRSIVLAFGAALVVFSVVGLVWRRNRTDS
jgi:hypothetical protein